MKAKIKPGSMCWMNSQCGIERNVGIVVSVIELSGVEDGQNVWHIHSNEPMLCMHTLYPALLEFRRCCCCQEYALTLINGDETENSEVKENDTSGVL